MKYINFKFNNIAREKNINGRKHLIVNAIMLQQGVFNGDFYPDEEIKKSVNLWNGKAVTVNHPTTASANNLDNEENIVVGKIFNTRYSDKKLKAELYIDIEKAKSMGFNNIIQRLKNNEEFEGSTGLQTDDIPQSGIYNNQQYQFKVTNFIPDHYAILLNEQGAFSRKQGGGVGMHKNKLNNEDKMTKIEVNSEDYNNLVKEAGKISNLMKQNNELQSEIDKLKKIEKEYVEIKKNSSKQLSGKELDEFKLYKENQKKEREELIVKVKKNHALSDDSLNVMQVEDLKKLAQDQGSNNYSLNTKHNSNATDDISNYNETDFSKFNEV